LGFMRAGFVAYYIPASVIKGMLAAIGIILILKQLPHAIGYDHELFGLAFQEANDENTFTALLHAFGHIEFGALIISLLSVIILIAWENSPLKSFHWLPGALFVVLFGVGINALYAAYYPNFNLAGEHLVEVPVVNKMTDFFAGFTTPDWSYISNGTVWLTGLTIGLVASIESLLTVEAVDKIDPYKRKSPLNRELLAQGTANLTAGLIGGIPLTSVIVRSSANINSGGRTKMAAFFHGIFLLFAVLFISKWMNLVPLASLAAILLVIGYKLTKPSIYKSIFSKGIEQFIPFVVTILAILFTDLLIGVGIGIMVGFIFVIRSNFHSSVLMTRDGDHYLIRLNKDVSFLNKPLLMECLESIEEGGSVIIDGTRAQFIDSDISEVLEEFKEEARTKNINVIFKNTDTYSRIKMNGSSKVPVNV
ncbi:MAG: SulP family inorganic anion transporter, partial [Bacteroidota bacterium]